MVDKIKVFFWEIMKHFFNENVFDGNFFWRPSSYTRKKSFIAIYDIETHYKTS